MNIAYSIPTQSKNRKFSVGDAMVYRFAFNGKEKDDETYGGGNAYDFGARIYDPRLGRWFSVDPMAFKGPQFSPYNFALNAPIFINDPDGNWVEITTTKYYRDKNGDCHIKKWYHVFHKTIAKEINIKIHNLKVYNHNGLIHRIEPQSNGTNRDYFSAPNEAEMKQAADGIKSSLLRAYENIYKKDGNREVHVTLEIVEEIQIVKSLDEVQTQTNSKGRIDNLIILVNDASRYAPGNMNAAGGTDHPNVSIMDLSDALALGSSTAPHEFTHQRYPPSYNAEADHRDGGIFDPKIEKPNFKNLWKMDSRGNGTNMNDSEIFQKIKKEIKL